jgi:PHP family Zn ribbon phosphoesterase
VQKQRTDQPMMTWRRVDLHIHTPASSHCYEDKNASYLDILERADQRGLDIIAVTDHNTVAGVAGIRGRIQELALLERLNRLQGNERKELDEYRRLGNKMLILPGFEFTATLGFHILGIFPPETSVRELEHVLLNLRVPADKLDLGSSEIGATVDVLTAYSTIAEAGGLVIAAHANSAHGVALRGFDFGGQTKIAYTQDAHLNALEVTDLERTGRRTTASFFDGSKPDYPRRMHCIQGSDAHSLEGNPKDEHRKGVGERATEILLPEASFEALKAVFVSTDFTRTRPYRPAQPTFDFVEAAQQAGASLVQSFHEKASRQGGYLTAVLRDVVAFANTNGGVAFVGASAKPKSPPLGVERAEEAARSLMAEIRRAVTPPVETDIDLLKSRGKTVLRVSVPRGPNPPYALEGVEVYIRQEGETSRAMRDELVQLVYRAAAPSTAKPVAAPVPAPASTGAVAAPVLTPSSSDAPVPPPRTGVEIVEAVDREGTTYYALRDLRNGNLIRDVTKSSARRLWRYAITDYEKQPIQADKVEWRGTIGLWKSYRRLGRKCYDLVQRDDNAKLRMYYGVTDDGMHGEWAAFGAEK